MLFKKIVWIITLCSSHALLGITFRDFPSEVQAIYDGITPLIMVPFDISMRQEKYASTITRQNTEQEVGVSGELFYRFLKKRWESLSYDALTECNTLRIPKIIHQIWIGNGVPAELKPLQKLWQLMHSGWEYHLWTQHNINDLPLINRTFIDAAQKS
jgi:hypothetical protein